MRSWILLAGLAGAGTAHASVHIKDVQLIPGSGGWRVSVQASAPTPCTVHSLPDPDRLIIDIPDAVLDVDSQVKPPAPGIQPSLRYSQFSRDPASVRVVVSLPPGASASARAVAPTAAINLWIKSEAPRASAPEAKSASVRAAAPAAKTAPASAVKPSKAAVRTVPAAHGEISALKLERRLKASGKLNRSAPLAKPYPPLPDPREAAPADRSSVASRGGDFARVDAALGSLVLPEAVPSPAPAPAWTPEEAIAYIRDGNAPDALRKRLVELVSDPVIQTSRYVWGAESPGQFDCSGLALYLYEALDVKLPRCSWQQCEVGELVDRDSLRAGDLVFFDTKGKGVSHVGIYLGDGKFLHAANPRSNLQITGLENPYYSKRFVCARRVYGIDPADTTSLGG